MRSLLRLIAAATLLAAPALAQTAPTARTPLVDPAGPPMERAQGAPDLGTLSESQARARLETDGYGGVSTLLRGRDGRWHGKAVRDGTTVDVTIDRFGNVVSE